jgi:hypothetical protein
MFSGPTWTSSWRSSLFSACEMQSRSARWAPGFHGALSLGLISSCSLDIRGSLTLENSRTFWRILLEGMARQQQLPLHPWDESLAGRSAAELRVLAKRTRRAHCAFRGDSAGFRSTSTMRLPSGFSLLGVVSGTDVALLHSIQTGKLMCMNLMTGGVSYQMQGNFWILSQSDFHHDTSRDLATVALLMSDIEELEHPRCVAFDLIHVEYMSTNARCRVFRIQVYEIL